MADPFTTAFGQIGADFETYFGALLANVTVKQIDPDAGTATTTVSNVPALKRSRRRQPFGVGGGGELGQDQCRFVFKLARISWVPRARDQIVDAAAIAWDVESVELIAFNQLVAVNVVIKR